MDRTCITEHFFRNNYHYYYFIILYYIITHFYLEVTFQESVFLTNTIYKL